MEKDLYVVKAKDRILSCNFCYARTYKSSIPGNTDREVDQLFEIHIGSMVSVLCEECIAKLTGRLNSAMLEIKRATASPVDPNSQK